MSRSADFTIPPIHKHGNAMLAACDKAKSPLEWVFLGAGLLATVGVTIWVSRIAKNALKKSGAAEKKEN